MKTNASKPPQDFRYRTRLAMCPIEERRWLADFMREWHRRQASRIEALLPRVSAREISRQLECLPPHLFPEDADGGETRLEIALIRAMQAKGENVHDVLNGAPDGSAKPDYFRADKCLRLSEYSF
jgi:hypothetical protein